MPFVEADKYQIIKYLFLPISQASTVQACLDAVESEILIEQIQGLLTQLDNLAALVSAERNSPNSALIKADVIEWEGGGKRVEGMLASRQELTLQLANLLGLRVSGSSCRPMTSSVEIQVY